MSIQKLSSFGLRWDLASGLITCRQLSIEELFGDAALEVGLADPVNVEDGLAEAGKTVGNTNTGTGFWWEGGDKSGLMGATKFHRSDNSPNENSLNENSPKFMKAFRTDLTRPNLT